MCAQKKKQERSTLRSTGCNVRMCSILSSVWEDQDAVQNVAGSPSVGSAVISSDRLLSCTGGLAATSSLCSEKKRAVIARKLHGLQLEMVTSTNAEHGVAEQPLTRNATCLASS